MKVWLLYENSESGPKEAYVNRNEIIQDMNLDIIFKFMARNDKFIYKVAQAIMTNPLKEAGAVLYRQGIIKDCAAHYDNTYKIYEMSAQTVEIIEHFNEGSKRANASNISNAASVLFSLELLGFLVETLEKLKLYLDTIEKDFKSNGLRAFYNRLLEDYSFHFVEEIKNSIKNMNFLSEGGEITFSGSLGQGLKLRDLIVNDLEKESTSKKKGAGNLEKEAASKKKDDSILEKETASKKKGTGFMATLIEKILKRNMIMLEDSKLSQDAKDMEAAGLAHVMKLYQGFIKELASFFENLHYQMAFYIGAANLKIRLDQMHIPTSMPHIQIRDFNEFKFQNLYDMSLAIYSRSIPVWNDLDTLDTKLFIITGANQGGKSTYLRSIGIAQLLMQCGMFVPAKYYCNKLFDGIFSHFTRREDASMNSGKLDEELARMNRILLTITPNSLLLMNESFATTTEREGTKIAKDVVDALYENGTTIIMVTHLFEFTKTMYGRNLPETKFLSAERLPDGTRTFIIYEHEPERTSYGLDLYDMIVKG